MIEIEKLHKECKTLLNYEGFEKYYLDNKYNNDKYSWIYGKQQWLFRFENNYGASVIKHWGSYGFEDDLFELAVIKFNNHYKKLYGNDFELVYDTPITNDVIGHLTNNDVLRYLHKIQRLDEHGR